MSSRSTVAALALALAMPLAALAADPPPRITTTRVPLQGIIKVEPAYEGKKATIGGVELPKLKWGFWVPPCAASGRIRVTTIGGQTVDGPHIEITPAGRLTVDRADPPLQMGEPHRDRTAGFGWKRGDAVRLHGSGFVKGMHVRIGIDEDQRRPAKLVSPSEVEFVVPLTRRRALHWVLLEHPDGRMTPVPNNKGFPSIRHPTMGWAGCPGAKPYQWH
ncbi:MAG: hypothetical protein OXR73_35550 [Myxococcales bacterium]|nr:hypothetical protein [Myxococcales bacterium]